MLGSRLGRLPPFFRFAISGVLAFAVDAIIVQSLVSLAAVHPYPARLVSFLCAASVTWRFNRQYTFMPPPGMTWWREGLAYLGTQAVGFVLNYLTYALVLGVSGTAWRWPIIGVAAGSLAGMLSNYFSAARLVYRGSRR